MSDEYIVHFVDGPEKGQTRKMRIRNIDKFSLTRVRIGERVVRVVGDGELTYRPTRIDGRNVYMAVSNG